jgi:CRP-like cAMP-binding protein
MPDLLARYPSVTAALPESLVQQLGGHATLVRARGGQTLTSMGSSSTNVFLVLEGRVQVAIFSLEGREVILRDLSAGAIFGELAALDSQPRSATIVALGDCLLASVPGEVFRNAACGTPAAAGWLARRLVGQIRDLTEKVFELNALRVPSRLHCELLRLCGTQGQGTPAVIEPFPTHAELASRIGTHREAVTREMRFLAGQGIVAQQRRRMVVTDLPALVGLVRDAAGVMSDLGQASFGQ